MALVLKAAIEHFSCAAVEALNLPKSSFLWRNREALERASRKAHAELESQGRRHNTRTPQKVPCQKLFYKAFLQELYPDACVKLIERRLSQTYARHCNPLQLIDWTVPQKLLAKVFSVRCHGLL